MSAINAHNLKIKPQYFKDVVDGKKTFEVRYNNRDFKVGDILVLEEFDEHGHTGKYLNVETIYILDDKEYLKDGYVALGFKLRLDMGGKFE